MEVSNLVNEICVWFLFKDYIISHLLLLTSSYKSYSNVRRAALGRLPDSYSRLV